MDPNPKPDAFQTMTECLRNVAGAIVRWHADHGMETINKSRGKWIFRSTWLSPCSIHMNSPKERCAACRAGEYSNDLLRDLEGAFYDRFPRAWRWWANRRWFNFARDRLEKVFPGLRQK